MTSPIKLTQRPIRQVYLEAMKAAQTIEDRARRASYAATGKDKELASDIAFATNRFAKRAQKASDQVISLMNDGSLRAFCTEFDKLFKLFINNVDGWEKELARIELDVYTNKLPDEP